MLTVRQAVPGDAMDVAVVHVRSWQVGYRGLVPDEVLNRMRPEDRVARYDFDPERGDGVLTLVAVDGDAVHGFATIGTSRTEMIGEVWALYVDPDHWRLGVGRLLIVEARARLVRRGFDQAILWVMAGNERAERFYRADGWWPDGGRKRDKHWGVLVDELRYRRAL